MNKSYLLLSRCFYSTQLVHATRQIPLIILLIFITQWYTLNNIISRQGIIKQVKLCLEMPKKCFIKYKRHLIYYIRNDTRRDTIKEICQTMKQQFYWANETYQKTTTKKSSHVKSKLVIRWMFKRISTDSYSKLGWCQCDILPTITTQGKYYKIYYQRH